MRLGKFATSFLALSLLIGCAKLKVDVCISSPKDGGFVCVKPDDSEYFLTYENSENYLALSPDDARTVVEACRIKDQEE